MTAVRVVEPPNVPEICIGVDVTRMADEAIGALAKDGAVYQRAGALVRVVRSTEPPKLEGARFVRPAGVPIVRVMSHATLLERLSSCARWLKFNGKTKAWSQTLPSEPAARAAGARGEWGGVRPLLSVTSAPTMRADGSILQAPGYDADTGLLYWPNGTYHTVPDAPTLEDAQDAYRALCETVCDFPFARDEHKAAWVSAVLTLLGRAAIDGPVPMIAIDATTRGTGKSMLADAAFRVAFGHGAARTSQPEDEDEFRKRITALAVEGDAAVLIDNINRQIGGASIEAALTGGMWKDRVLGITGMVTVPMLIVWFATGNNLEFSSDVARRTLHIRLESPLENPEEREDFKHANLMRWIDEKRGHLVTWALTILRAWHVAGRPKLCKVWGSFEAWSAVVPNAVKWVSGLDPMAVRAAADESMDGDKMSIRALADCIEYLTQEGPITAKQLTLSLYGGDKESAPDHHTSFQGAREALETGTFTKVGQVPATTRVGKLLRKHLGRVVGGKRIVLGPVKANMQTWATGKVP